jgi:hypothetical protein
MKTPSTKVHTSLEHKVANVKNDEELYQKKRKAWLQGEGLHLNTAQINMLSLEHRWAIDIIGNLTYGKR